MIIYNIAVKTNLSSIYTHVHKLLMCGTTNASFHLLFVLKKLQCMYDRGLKAYVSYSVHSK